MCLSTNCFERIFTLLRSIHGSLDIHIKCNAQNYGLNTTEFMIMLEIYNNEGISSNDLCKRLDLPKSSVSRIVDALVIKGIVSRIVPEDNRRIVRLSIKEDFLNSKSVRDLNKELNDALLENIGPDKANRIISALEELKGIIV
jgi:MarR family transcriptional regulator, organic hydroperoxide resistance regulator